MKAGKQIGAVFLLALCLTGCQMEDINFEKEAAVLHEQYFLSSEGCLFETGKENNVLTFFEPETNKLVPLCTKEDCRHTSGEGECTACFLAEEADQIGIHDGKLWYIKSHSSEIVLCRADLTGENAEVMYTLEGSKTERGSNVLYDGFLYHVESEMNYDEKGAADGWIFRAVRVDLNTGERIDIVGPTLEAEIRLVDFQNGKVYFQYSANETYPDGAIVVYDCETLETSFLKLREGHLGVFCMNENYLVYDVRNADGNTLGVIDLESGEEIAGFPVDEYSSYDVFGNEILIGSMKEGYQRYDIASGETEQLAGEDFYRYFQVYFSTGEGYIGVVRSGGKVDYAYISREDFDRGAKATALTKDGWPVW